MSGDFDKDRFTEDSLVRQLTQGFVEPGESLDYEAANESLLEAQDLFVEDAGENIVGKLDISDPNVKKEIEDHLKRHGLPSSFLKMFEENSFRSYVQLIIYKITEFLKSFGFFKDLPPESEKKMKEQIEQTAYLDAKTYVQEEAKKIYKVKVRNKKFANKEDFETVGVDSKYSLTDFPARYDVAFINQFSEGLFQVESNNTAWGSWIENASEQAGAIGPSQIMFFNFPKWMKDAGYDWSSYYDKMTKDQKTFWDKYKKSAKSIYTSEPSESAPATKIPSTYKTVGSIMAAILRDVNATDGSILKNMTFTKLEEYFQKFKDWGVVAGSWYCGPGYANSPEREECRAYAEKVLSNFISNLEKEANYNILFLRKVSNFSNKLDKKKLFKEASIIDKALFNLSS